ncbi:DUF418 domain-containing protein [Sphingomonas koreensis]|nr:DUF418 domain-containing protein [Sphingomonas koreensis]
MAKPDRILTLDTIRGVAVMGILTMNIVAFAMPEAAYSNPRAYGGHTGADFAAWLASYILFDGKMRGLFSFLFGASMLLVIDRATAKGENAAVVHFSRMIWLFVFGMAHLLLLWWGDILNHYAMIGALAWFFRKLPPHKLVALAIVLLAIEFVFVLSVGHGIAAQTAIALGPHPTSQAIQAYEANRRGLGIPPPADIARDLAVHRGSYATIFVDRLPDALRAPSQAFSFLGFETLGYMLFGMAGLRSGLLTGAWSRRAYAMGAAVGFGIGIPAYALIALIPIRHGFDVPSVAASDLVWSEPFRPVMIFGWACLIVLLMRPGGALTVRIAAAGRMAFSNYLGTTLICTTLFYGYGFGLYGRLSRADLYLVVAGVWAIMLLWSKPWLARFRYGPLEWLWRSLARGQLQPIRKSANASQ